MLNSWAWFSFRKSWRRDESAVDGSKLRKDFFLYVDEFHNYATEDFAVILSEARKYRLNLVVANQFVAQIQEDVKNAVFGNVGSLISFRVGVPDANFLQNEFAPVFNETDLTNIEK